MTGLRRAGINLLTAAVSTLAVLALVEVAVRISGYEPLPPTWRRLSDGRWSQLLDCYPSNPRGYFDIDLRTPGAERRYRKFGPRRFDAIARLDPWAVEFRYNAQRFRGEDLAAKRPGVRRVMVLGDSFTEGQGVKEKDTTARVLGRWLDARAPGRFEVHNCGRRATDFPQLVQAFEDVLPFGPDLLVYALVLNDAEQTPDFRARHPYVADWILDQPLFEVNDAPVPLSPWRARLFDFVSGRVRGYRLDRATTRWYLEMWSDANPGWARTQRHIRHMDETLRARGARLLVVVWPLMHRLERGYPFGAVHERIRVFCASAGIAHHDLLRVFEGRRSRDLWVHAVDRHPNEIAHRMAAESMAPVVERLAAP